MTKSSLLNRWLGEMRTKHSFIERFFTFIVQWTTLKMKTKWSNWFYSLFFFLSISHFAIFKTFKSDALPFLLSLSNDVERETKTTENSNIYEQFSIDILRRSTSRCWPFFSTKDNLYRSIVENFSWIRCWNNVRQSRIAQHWDGYLNRT